MNFRPLFLFLSALVLFGCNRAALVVQQQKVSSSYLASGNVGTPDPRTPPNGEMILAEWWVPKDLLARCPTLRIEVIFKDFSQTCVEFPIRHRVGYETFAVLNNRFKETGGFMAYHIEIITEDGSVYADWTHQLWVRLIDLSEETEEINSAVVE
jgi:hypothetical protein